MNEKGIPEILYKYRSWQENEEHLSEDKKYQKRIINNSEIYFSNPKDFNDPFDSTIPKRYDKLTKEQKFDLLLYHVRMKFPNDSETDIYNKALEIFGRGHLLNVDYIQKSIQDDIDGFCNTHGVFSLAEHPDNILMWSHYGNSHRGFCIGFDSRKLWEYLEANKINREHHYGMFPVDYSNDYPVVMPSRDLKVVFKNVLIRILTKSILWQYEREYRCTLTGSTSQSYPIDPSLYREIIFGCKINQKVKEEISIILGHKYSHIKRFQANQDKDSFRLNIVAED